MPTDEIRKYLAAGADIQVRGIYPPDAEAALTARGFTDLGKIEMRQHGSSRTWNRIRPSFYETVQPNGTPALVCCVVPGIDYLLHYANLIRHYALTQSTEAAAHVKVLRYRDAEEHLEVWSRLPTDLIQPGDRIVLGYADKLVERWWSVPGLAVCPCIAEWGWSRHRRATDVLAYSDRPGTSNGPAEAINGRLEHLRGSALGFRNLTN